MAAAGGGGGRRAWRVIPRPVLETILHNHALHPRVPQPLILHGPRGVGKSTLLLHRLLPQWSELPHAAAFVDFLRPAPGSPTDAAPWSLLPDGPAPSLPDLRLRLESALEDLARAAVLRGAVGSKDVLAALCRFHGLQTALSRLAGPAARRGGGGSNPVPALWARAVLAASSSARGDDLTFCIGEGEATNCSMEERAYMQEAMAALRVAKEVLTMQEGWRKEAVREMNRTGRFSRPLANSAADWPCLLLDMLSFAAEVDFFQPKLVLNNVDVLRKASCEDETMVPAAMYHDSFIWRVIALGVNERCLPVIMSTSDGAARFRSRFSNVTMDTMMTILIDLQAKIGNMEMQMSQMSSRITALEKRALHSVLPVPTPAATMPTMLQVQAKVQVPALFQQMQQQLTVL